MWPLRSMLFVPAHKLDWARKASRFGPDSVVLDLEDAVPPHEKVAARATAREAIAILHKAGIAPFVRINALDVGGREDAAEICVPGLAGIKPPKSRTPEEMRELDVLLSHGEGRSGMALRSVSILVLPETAEGLWAARDLAAASPRVKGVAAVVGGPVTAMSSLPPTSRCSR